MRYYSSHKFLFLSQEVMLENKRKGAAFDKCQELPRRNSCLVVEQAGVNVARQICRELNREIEVSGNRILIAHIWLMQINRWEGFEQMF